MARMRCHEYSLSQSISYKLEIFGILKTYVVANQSETPKIEDLIRDASLLESKLLNMRITLLI